MIRDAHADASVSDLCGLYIHLPFCESKCGYCDFFSVALKGRATAPLVRSVVRELERRLSETSRTVRTVFMGGGTPTVLPLEELSLLLTSLGKALDVSSLQEFTVEANPATVDDDKAKLMVASGVTRVSMGAQSFFPDELATLERLHTPDDLAPSVQILRRSGVAQLNIDLIFGIPGQTVDTWSQSLARTIALSPDHISCYGLMYEPGTRLTAQKNTGRVTPCREGIEADMYELAIDTLATAGYEQYEISAFARPGCQCQHNLIYWRNGPYIGVGPSAAGCLGDRRYKNISDIVGYNRMIDADGHAEVESERIDVPTLVLEMVMMQLRLVEGLCVASFRRRTGHEPLTYFGNELERLVQLKLITVSDTHIAMTRAGRLVGDSVMAELVGAIDESDSHYVIPAPPR